MNISVGQLLQKMEMILHEAKQCDTEAGLREKTTSIVLLCDLILEATEGKSSVAERVKQSTASIQGVQPIISQPKRLHVDEDANGDSLFDF